MASYSGIKPRQPGHYHKQKQERRKIDGNFKIYMIQHDTCDM